MRLYLIEMLIAKRTIQWAITFIISAKLDVLESLQVETSGQFVATRIPSGFYIRPAPLYIFGQLRHTVRILISTHKTKTGDACGIPIEQRI